MKSRPIIFNAENVQAILEGRKTQTRRVIKSVPISFTGTAVYQIGSNNKLGGFAFYDSQAKIQYYRICPYGESNDQLWIRETIRRRNLHHAASDLSGATYAADHTPVLGNGPLGSYCGRATCDWKWKRDILPSIYMPRWASRITLSIVGIRVERLQDINSKDVRKEGCKNFTEFCLLWQSIHEKKQGNFNNNPWVWVIEFKRIEP